MLFIDGFYEALISVENRGALFGAGGRLEINGKVRRAPGLISAPVEGREEKGSDSFEGVIRTNDNATVNTHEAIKARPARER